MQLRKSCVPPLLKSVVLAYVDSDDFGKAGASVSLPPYLPPRTTGLLPARRPPLFLAVRHHFLGDLQKPSAWTAPRLRGQKQTKNEKKRRTGRGRFHSPHRFGGCFLDDFGVYRYKLPESSRGARIAGEMTGARSPESLGRSLLSRIFVYRIYTTLETCIRV